MVSFARSPDDAIVGSVYTLDKGKRMPLLPEDNVELEVLLKTFPALLDSQIQRSR